MNIIGQDKLLANIDRLSIENFPRTLLLVGEVGSGKHLFCSYIQNKLSFPLIDISTSLSLETIEQAMLRVEPVIYLIDTQNISIKEENIMLKFLEEPLKNTYIILLCTSTNLLLPTVVNRCRVWRLAPYSKDTLKTFLNSSNELILDIANTPGKVNQLQSYDLTQLLTLVNKLIDVIKTNGVANTLTLSNKITFTATDNDKYDFDVFIDTLLYVLKTRVFDQNDSRLIEYYKLTNKLSNDRFIPHINKKLLFEHYLLEMRGI